MRKGPSHPFVAIVSVAVAILFASVTTRPVSAQVSQARTHYERGRSYFQVGEYRKALDEFKAAHVEKNDPAYIYNIAECHRLLGESKDAVAFYQRFLRLVPQTHPLRSEAEQRITQLESPPAPMSATATPNGPASPPPPGPPPANAVPPTAAPAAATPAPARAPPISINESARDPDGASRSRRNAAYVVAGAGVLAVAVGGYFGFRARSKWNESDPHCPADQCDDVGSSLSEQAQTSARIADVAIGAGLVSVGVAMYLFLTSRAAEPSPQTTAWRIRLQPEIGPNLQAGLTLGASW